MGSDSKENYSWRKIEEKMEETIATQNQKDRYVHKIIPAISLTSSPNENQPQYQYTLSSTII